MSIASENALTGADINEYYINGAGDLTNLGFAREFSVNKGEAMHFSCHGAGTVLDIYRLGWYGGLRWRKITTLTNTATTQPAPTTVANSNGSVTCTAWSTTATWNVPSTTQSGMFMGVYRNAAGNNASYIPFVVRDDAAVADVIFKTSDATYVLAYNYYGTPSVPLGGKNWYGNGPLGSILDRGHYGTYHKPVVTREGLAQTYLLACELPLIAFLERNGYNVKYIASKDLDRDPAILDNGQIFLSAGHDEYWSAAMRTNVENYRDDGGKSIFMSGNEVFWKIRYDTARDGAWCFKDTMPGPGSHVAGAALDPVSWTGTWKDTRWPGRKPEWLLTGTDFRMNGINDLDATIVKNPYASHTVWGNSALNDGDITLTKIIGFEADSVRPTQPSDSTKLLAVYSRNINGAYADDDGQTYTGNGNLTWGIVSQRYLGGGLTVGFGTCQWGWCLDTVHDRGAGTPVSPAGQQFTINLLADLGAQPATRMAGMAARTAVSLDEYGLEPSAIVAPSSSGFKLGDGTQLQVRLGDGTQLAGVLA